MSSSSNIDFLPSLTFKDFEWLWNSSTDKIEDSLEDSLELSSRSSTTSSTPDFKDLKEKSCFVESSNQPVSHWKDLVPIRHMPEHPRSCSSSNSYHTLKATSEGGGGGDKAITRRRHCAMRDALLANKHCSYCKNASGSHAHYLYTEDGRVSCPLLRRVVCPYCGATGDVAHIGRRCPLPVSKIVHNQQLYAPCFY